MACTCGDNPCTGTPTCTCPIKDFRTDCSVYNGPTLGCSGIQSGTILTTVIENLDAFICNKFDEAINYLTLLNVGGAAEVYKGINGIGNKEIRTLATGDATLIDVVQNTNTIDFTPGTPSLDLTSNILSFIVTTVGGANTFDTVDLSAYVNNPDTFVQTATFNPGDQVLTITRNNGEVDITVDLSFLNNPGGDTNTYVASGTYNAGLDTITLTLSDASTVGIDIATLVTEILADAAAAQVQADVLETNPAEKAYISNKNPTKTVVLGAAGNYNVVDGDNNYVIEIDNGVNNVTITVSGVTLTDNYFVGFIQKGTGTVTFVGHDVLPAGLTAVMIGEGHQSALEIINSTKYIFGGLNPI